MTNALPSINFCWPSESDSPQSVLCPAVICHLTDPRSHTTCDFLSRINILVGFRLQWQRLRVLRLSSSSFGGEAPERGRGRVRLSVGSLPATSGGRLLQPMQTPSFSLMCYGSVQVCSLPSQVGSSGAATVLSVSGPHWDTDRSISIWSLYTFTGLSDHLRKTHLTTWGR